MRRNLCLFFIAFLLVNHSAYSQGAIVSGYLETDSTWIKKVYISRITDFNQMFTASDQLIVAAADIDSTGFFKATVPATEEECLYRLHAVKKGDPVSTLIIGSREENHVFFIAKNSGVVELVKSAGVALLNQQCIRGDKANTELNSLLYALKNEHIRRDSLKQLLVNMAGSFTSPLAGLLAVHSTFGLTAKLKASISKTLARYDKNNPYGVRIFDEYKIPSRSYTALFIWLILLLPAAYFVYRIYFKRKSVRIKNLLSQREKTIVQLILEGKTNKEIANTINIELSTVKTHVNNVYAKLKINDRKELQKYEHIFRG